MEQHAIAYAVSVLRNASDWQDAQDALANHAKIGPWLEENGDPLAEAQRIIRLAEDRLGDQLPY